MSDYLIKCCGACIHWGNKPRNSYYYECNHAGRLGGDFIGDKNLFCDWKENPKLSDSDKMKYTRNIDVGK